MAIRVDLTGRKFNRLTVISEDGDNVICRCDCGKAKTARRDNVTGRKTQSCGCLRNEKTILAQARLWWGIPNLGKENE